MGTPALLRLAACAALIGAGWIPGSLPVAAQQPGQAAYCASLAQGTLAEPCPPAQPAPIACFFRSAGFIGASFCEPVGVRRNSLGPWQDSIGSIWLFNGAKVRACTGSHLSGECRDYGESVARLAAPLRGHVGSLSVY